MKSFLKNHWPAFLFALVVGFIVVSPQLALRFELGARYQGIYLTGVDGEVYYPRIQEVYDGNYKATSPAVYEYKNEPYAFPPGPENTMVFLAKLFRLNVSQMIIFSNFLFPFLLCLIFYFLFFKITSSRLIALTSSVAIILLSNFVFFPRNLINLFLHPAEVTFNPYNRPIHPQVSSVYFYLWLLLFWVWFKEQKKIYLILSGLVFGLLFYIYPFAWMLALGMQGLLLLYGLYERDFQKFKSLLLALGVGFLISVFYWINFFHLVNHPLYEALVKHNGFYHSREPLFGAVMVLGLILLVLLYRFERKSQKFLILAAAIISGIILTNQQIVTNFRFFPGHWYWYYLVPFSIFLAIFTFFSIFKSRKRILYAGSVLVIGIAVVGGLVSERNYYLAEKGKAVENQRYAALFRWLNQNTASESVVLTPDPLAIILPAYTSNNHYLVDAADVLSLIPDDRFRHDFFVKIYLEGAREGNLDEHINQRTPVFIELLYGYYRRYAYGCTECYLEEDLVKLKEEYLEFLKKDFESEVKKYKIDYFVIDRKTNKWNYEDLKFIKPVTEVGDFLIFEVI